MWNVILDSIEGTSHLREQLGCQDSSACAEIDCTGGERRLCLVCSDGAGSARCAAEASQFTCQWFLKMLGDHFHRGGIIGDLDRDCIVQWTNSLRSNLELRAQETEQFDDQRTANGASPTSAGTLARAGLHDYACTLILAVIESDCALFAQIGDGAIVRWDGSDYKTVFWPQTGEYLNTTVFITSGDVANNLNYLFHPEPVSELALLTDGLQMISLDFSRHQAHQPFFTPLFTRLRGAEPGDVLSPLLTVFLQSEKVNERTDDDKTLILASRIGNGR